MPTQPSVTIRGDQLIIRTPFHPLFVERLKQAVPTARFEYATKRHDKRWLAPLGEAATVYALIDEFFQAELVTHELAYTLKNSRPPTLDGFDLVRVRGDGVWQLGAIVTEVISAELSVVNRRRISGAFRVRATARRQAVIDLDGLTHHRILESEITSPARSLPPLPAPWEWRRSVSGIWLVGRAGEAELTFAVALGPVASELAPETRAFLAEQAARLEALAQALRIVAMP